MSTQKWPGYGQDREAARLVQERKREEQIKADNLSARIRAADPVVNVNIGADFLAGLMEAARQQPAPVYVQSETIQQQEIR